MRSNCYELFKKITIFTTLVYSCVYKNEEEVTILRRINFYFKKFPDIPAAVSYPHFYRSDPSLLDEVEGLDPNAEKHSTEIVLQPVS